MIMSKSLQLKSYILERQHVHCADVEQVLTKLEKITADGQDKLQVLCDFDHTLTCYQINGQFGCTSHGIIENTTLLSDTFRQKARNITEKYRPLEVSKQLDRQEKIALMNEWWHSIHQLIIDEKVSQDSLQLMVDEANIGFREYHDKLTQILDDFNIPLTILSAGLADTIQLVYQSQSHLSPNMNIYGNKMIFNTEGVVIDFHQPIIHSYSKALVNCDHLKTKLKDRCNVVLIGDSQGDPDMSKGLDYIENIIKIGFLNHHENDLLPVYEKLYDIVLLGPDNTLELPYLLLMTILEH